MTKTDAVRSVHIDAPSPAGNLARGGATWYSWLLVGSYVYALSVQGNALPFLQAEFGLSYRAVSLHSSAIAAGIILVGLFGERVIRRIGRRASLRLAAGGLAAGSVLLCLSPAPWASIASCFLIGLIGTLIHAVVPALLADIHGERRAEAYAGQAIVACVFGLSAPLVTGVCIALALGWRAAVVVGGILAIAIALGFRRTVIVERAPREQRQGGALPPAFWAYWALCVAATALEFSILIWAPAYQERVVGLGPAAAATAAAGFPLGMLVGRIVLRRLVRRIAPRRLLVAALAIVFLGFLLYRGVGWPAIAVVGTFVIGLGIGPLYPLSASFAVGSAADKRDIASVRLAIAFGISLLLAPIALGTLADQVGLGPAHLVLPALIAVACCSFFTAEALQRRSTVSTAA